MEGSKLILLIKTFNKSEWRRFKEFLASPYFNKREDLLDFIKYLESIKPDFSGKKIAKEKVYKYLFPNGEYDDKQMRYLMNYALKLAEEFIGYQKIEKDNLINRAILEELVDRKLDKHYKTYYNKISNSKKYSSISESYFEQYKLAEIANKHFNNQSQRKDDKNLQIATQNLDLFYLYNKLKNSCGLVNRQKLFQTSYDLSLTDLLHSFLSKQAAINQPLIAIYSQIYAIFTKEEAAENFEMLKQLIGKFDDNIPPLEKQHIYLYAINYCGRQIKLNNQINYHAEQCLGFYLEGIQQEFLFINGNLSPWTFKNVVKLGFNLKKYDWTEQFIQEYYKKLAPEFQEDALHYNLADLYYRKKKYKEAQYHLLLVEYSDIFYSINAKAMLLKIYYETGEEEALFSLIASFSIYLKRNKKISEDVQAPYLNFTSLLHQILRVKREKILEVIEKINQTELLTNRSWLLQICEQKRHDKSFSK